MGQYRGSDRYREGGGFKTCWSKVDVEADRLGGGVIYSVDIFFSRASRLTKMNPAPDEHPRPSRTLRFLASDTEVTSGIKPPPPAVVAEISSPAAGGPNQSEAGLSSMFRSVSELPRASAASVHCGSSIFHACSDGLQDIE